MTCAFGLDGKTEHRAELLLRASSLLRIAAEAKHASKARVCVLCGLERSARGP